MKLSLISPTYNEAQNVARLVEEVGKYLCGVDYEIILCDDDSPDGTWEVAERIAGVNPHVRVLRRRQDRGLTRSVMDGFAMASGEVVACMDADLQHDPVILPKMLNALAQGADVVVGSRYVAGGSTGEWKFTRRASSWMATKSAHWALGVDIHDPMSGYFMLRRKDFLRVRDRLRAGGFKILLEIVANLNAAQIVEIPFTFRPRLAGTSKLTGDIVWAYAVQLWHLWRDKQGREHALERKTSGS